MKDLEKNLGQLKLNLLSICSKNTCYSKLQKDWTPTNPFLGHCAIITAVVYKNFGGKIMRGVIKENGASHYWNNINGVNYDLTKEQFNGKVTFTNIEEVSIYRILNNFETANRFLELNKKLDNLIFKQQKEQSL